MSESKETIPVSDPHQPGTPAGTDPADIERRAAVAPAFGLGTESQRF